MTRSFRLASSPADLMSTTSKLTNANRWDHFVARMGIRRSKHRVLPGLYKLNTPDPSSPVFVTANYSLSFDALRSVLLGINAYILVLDTRGVNVWCAAGKHTFGTTELIRRIKVTHLKDVVSHRRLILPQLGAPGVAAHIVKEQTGFVVEYGPVRAADLPEYMKTHHATPEMREVKFPLRDRLVLIPVEVNLLLLPILAIAAASFFLGGWSYALAVLLVMLGGAAFFPILLPILPTHDFSSKGAILGFLLSLPFAVFALINHPAWHLYSRIGQALGFILAMTASVAYISLNFTGSTPFTSRTGVRKEIYRYIRPMAVAFVPGVILLIVFGLLH